jgi:hypothetical protein
MSMAKMPVTGYCFKCTVQRGVKETTTITLKNGRLALEGICVVCGNKIFTIPGAATDAQPTFVAAAS